MRYEFHPEALDEHQEATLHYAERDPALALRFVEAVEDAIRRILEAPERRRVPSAQSRINQYDRSRLHTFGCYQIRFEDWHSVG